MINRDWIDVDSDRHGTGCLPREDRLGDTFAEFEREVELIPRSEWEERARRMVWMEDLVQRIHNQGREGSCVGQGVCGAWEILFAATYGLRRAVQFSSMSIYKQIGRSASSGAMITDGLKQITNVGILPLDNAANRERFTHVHTETGFSRSMPRGWRTTAAKFQVTEWYDVGSFDGLVTCLLDGIPVVYGRARHCICGVRLIRDNNTWYVKYRNSWGRSWGDEGFGYDSESYLRRYGIGRYGVFAPRATKLWEP